MRAEIRKARQEGGPGLPILRPFVSPREASSNEVKELRRENIRLKEALAEEMLENRILKKA